MKTRELCKYIKRNETRYVMIAVGFLSFGGGIVCFLILALEVAHLSHLPFSADPGDVYFVYERISRFNGIFALVAFATTVRLTVGQLRTAALNRFVDETTADIERLFNTELTDDYILLQSYRVVKSDLIDDLMSRDFVFKSRKEVENYFTKHWRSRAKLCEIGNVKYLLLHARRPDSKPYSLKAFIALHRRLIKKDDSYAALFRDLEQLYYDETRSVFIQLPEYNPQSALPDETRQWNESWENYSNQRKQLYSRS